MPRLSHSTVPNEVTVNEVVISGLPQLPVDEEDSRSVGFTGDQCPECGQRTLIEDHNDTGKFLVCVCTYRFVPDPL